VVELVSDVGEDEAARAGAPGVVAGVAGAEVAGLGVRRRVAERGLGHQQVGVAGELDELVGRARVGAEDEAPAGGGDPDRVGGDEVRDLGEADTHVADLERVADAVLGQGERALDEVLAAPRATDAAERLAGARRRIERGAGRALARAVGQRVGPRHEVEEVIGVQVADDDGVDRRVVDLGAQLREDAVAAIEQQTGVVLLDEIAGAGTARVLPGR